MASLVTTPQPPAVVSTTTFGPFGSGWVANVAAASNASSTVAARVTPAWRHAPSKTLSSAASAPVWLAAARAPFAVAPPFTTTSGLRAATDANRSSSAATVDDALHVGERHRRGRVVGVPVEVVGRGDRGGVAGRHGAADADAGLARVVEEAADEVAALAGDGDAAGRRVRARRSGRTGWPAC